jgi:hypothetical protein
MDGLTDKLFEALMNRIYNAHKFERLSPPSDSERFIIEAYLDIKEKARNEPV